MTNLPPDELWPHFLPSWQEWTSIIGNQTLLVAGGYGLFLKQRWLQQKPNMPIMVPLNAWRDSIPRVTKDLDLVLGLDLIADAAMQKHLLATLTKHQFIVSKKNPRWQFIKTIAEHRSVVVELHAPQPNTLQQNLKADSRRVKRRPSLGDQGIHARINEEAIGCELYPFVVMVDNVALTLPNPLTWSVMKLTAAHQRWTTAQNDHESAEKRAFSRNQAVKHINDACRIVAMMTREENDTAVIVAQQINNTEVFAIARNAFDMCLVNDQAWAPDLVSEFWQPEDFNRIRSTLAAWFPLP
jgi:hypothetical protein